ncbi:hypothetical protein A2483_02810 [Candidatus Peregrinibacteria bacterium RIFOXYC2_FULL_33_13]|nr:MAG: internalization-related competence protein ComEC/Rec2 protein [Candidatus Peregrinibacteria bacterium GW2011_GWA2_33_10]KKP40792.1 MAG: internalization-related competence protein ComEC/Rec2, competence protein ComEC protein [Candidatus Peregrinibacteria bacterium GW2011_GWC2_33_13]OGJ54183.1 MAG: hypothetical protein A2483_02810 [Candidatus Peregrinibacteria bacterium RIFOXYC2_FULL_33_13]
MTRLNPITFLFLSFIAGIFIHFGIACAFFLLLLIFLIFSLNESRNYILALFLIGFFVFGVFRLNLWENKEKRLWYYQLNHEKLLIQGQIKKKFSSLDNQSKYIFQVELIENEEIEENILLYMKRYPELETGDRLKMTGQLREPASRYQNYLKIYDVRFVVFDAEILYVEKCGNGFKYALSKVRLKILDIIKVIFPEPYSGFMNGIFLGEKNDLPEELNQKMRLAGLSHILVVSGYNITLIAICSNYLFSFLGRKIRIVLTGIMILFFMFLAGFDSSILRAGIMGVLSLFALWCGRIYEVFTGIFFAAFLMCLLNPMLIFYDDGFKLSFLATMGIALGAEHFKILGNNLKLNSVINDLLSVTFSAQLAVLPILVFKYHQFTFFSFISNLLVVPLIPWTMLLGAISFGFYFLYFDLSLVFGYLAWGLIELIFRIADLFYNL